MGTWKEQREARKAADQAEYEESVRRAKDEYHQPPTTTVTTSLPPPPGEHRTEIPVRSDIPTARTPSTGVGRAAPLIGLAGGALLVIGSVMPWASIASGFGGVSVSGTEGDGKVTLVIGLVIVVLTLLELANGAQTRALYGLAGVIGGGLGLYHITNVNNIIGGISNAFVHASIGTGLYLVVAGGAAALIAAVLKR